jgi:hypothetical protein
MTKFRSALLAALFITFSPGILLAQTAPQYTTSRPPLPSALVNTDFLTVTRGLNNYWIPATTYLQIGSLGAGVQNFLTTPIAGVPATWLQAGAAVANLGFTPVTNARAITAGTGLAGGCANLTANCSFSLAAGSATANLGYTPVPNTTTVTGTGMLTGGGALTGNITISMAATAANTVVMNGTAGSAVPTALPVPVCPDINGQHLNYSSGIFACGVSGGSGSGGGSPIAVSGPTGSPVTNVTNVAFGNGFLVAVGGTSTTATVNVSAASNNQTAAAGGNYTIQATDANATVLVNGGGVTTVPIPSTAGFGLGAGFCVQNAGASSAATTLTTTAGTNFVGTTGTNTMPIRKTDIACPSSNGTNYETAYLFSGFGFTSNRLMLGGGASATLGEMASAGTTTQVLHGNAAGPPTWSAIALAADVSGNLGVANLNSGTGATSGTAWTGNATWQGFPIVQALGWSPGIDPGGQSIFVAPMAMTITSINVRVDALLGAAGTITVVKAPNGTACSGGTLLHTGSANANTGVNSGQTLTLVAAPVINLAINDSVCVLSSGGASWTGGTTGKGVVTVSGRTL